MKVVLAGSLGRVNVPLVHLLEKNSNFDISIISSNESRANDIKSLGKNFSAAIGSLHNVDFLTEVLHEADVFYAMIPPGDVMDPSFSYINHYKLASTAFLSAILANSKTIRKVVFLSTVGAHMESGNGVLQGATQAEKLLRKGLKDTNIDLVVLRPVAFYYTLLQFAPLIKQTGKIMSNYGGEDICYWVSPKDIALVAYHELLQKKSGKYKVRYIVSEKKTCNEVARIIGKHIGIPDLMWVAIPDEALLNSLLELGMNPIVAKDVVEMQSTIRNQIVFEDMLKKGNMPVFGPTKLEEYVAQEFKQAYAQN